jgi:hypothetical protein
MLPVQESRLSDKAHSYIIGQHLFRISDLIERFADQAARVYSS